MGKKIKIALCIAAGVFLLSPSFIEFASAQQGGAVDFKRDIEPIFQANCYGCHGAKKASAQLRLDSKQLAMKGGFSGAVILPGKSKESRLVHRIQGAGGEKQMPLGGEPLKPAQIELIKRWIDQGAPWPDDSGSAAKDAGLPKHWAFVAPTVPKSPLVKNGAWVRTPVDNFILARIEKQGIAPSPEASKEVLIRRLSLDLTGLPPTLKEIDQFLADRSPDAYEKLVERLLASPHYGERWGRWWLDAARYADSNGFEKDLPRSIWPYRDWVINAFNEDMPFDRFTIEQLAGDLLPNATLDQRVATGFLRNSMLNQEGGVDPEQFRVEGIIDRVDAVGKAFLGLTVNCAQCHTHKFDPITHNEYYQFYAFLNSDDEPELEVPVGEIKKKQDDILGQIARIEDELKSGDPDLARRMKEWEENAKLTEGKWFALEDGSTTASFGVKFDRLEDHSFITKGDNSTANVYVVKVRTKLRGITGFRLETLADKALPRGGPGRSNDGLFYLSEFILDAAPLDQAGEPSTSSRNIAFSSATADFSHPDHPIMNTLDGNIKTQWGVDAGPVRRNQDRRAVFVANAPIDYANGAALTFQLVQKFDETISSLGGKANIGRFRLSATTQPDPQVDPLPTNVRRILSIPAANRTAQQQREVFSYYRTTDPKFAEANKRIDALMTQWVYGPTTLALAERAPGRETRIFRRGDWKRPGDPVAPGTPAILHPFPKDAPRNRLGLAKWIVDKDNPLTARVIVNRIWQQYFGNGLVATAEDFGSRCDLPSHPELLDWLATQFIQKGWSIKQIHRSIVNSATYRQSSGITPKLLEVDPNNRWLARSPRLRVESEIIRDIAFAASGLLSPRIGGPPVYPPIPDGVLSLGYGSPMKWETAMGDNRYRRAMYTFWKRSVPYPSLAVFDSPNGDFSCTRRIRSNTPLQSLTTLNDPLFMEAAQGLAIRVFKEGGADDRAKIIYGFRLCTGRAPDDFEIRQLTSLLEDQKSYFNGRTAAAVYVSSADLNRLPDDLDLHRLAPWTMVARVLLNMDETITRE